VGVEDPDGDGRAIDDLPGLIGVALRRCIEVNHEDGEVLVPDVGELERVAGTGMLRRTQLVAPVLSALTIFGLGIC
jgi:hypothetical protein